MGILRQNILSCQICLLTATFTTPRACGLLQFRVLCRQRSPALHPHLHRKTMETIIFRLIPRPLFWKGRVCLRGSTRQPHHVLPLVKLGSTMSNQVGLPRNLLFVSTELKSNQLRLEFGCPPQIGIVPISPTYHQSPWSVYPVYY